MPTARAALLPALLLALLLGPAAAPADPAPAAAVDPLTARWQQRARLAGQRLAKGGLDACDRGVEQAFQQVEEAPHGQLRSFFLRIPVGGQTMVVAYEYEGARLARFTLARLPERWFAYQDAGSRSLTVLLGDAQCALDLCTADPLAEGRCPGDPAPR